jgi:hypothetical protein
VSPRSRTAASTRLGQERTAAYDDARSLAIELGRGSPTRAFDELAAGIVLIPNETVYRSTEAWLRMQTSGVWGQAQSANVMVSDKRLLCRLSDGRWTSLWWNGVVGLQVDLAGEHVTLDYGDGEPMAVSGIQAPSISVAAVAFVHGVEALIRHPALNPLRAAPVVDA